MKEERRTKMDSRTRRLESILFGRPDRVSLEPGGGRKSTRERWLAEGLKEGADPVEQAYREAGGTFDLQRDGGPGFGVDFKMRPFFEEKVIERKSDSQIVQDWKGNVCEIGLEFSTEYLREAIDFVTRRWIKCPVESHADWEEMKWRYDAEEATRLPANAKALGESLKERNHFIEIHFNGPFWQLREWLGFENLCMMFHDDPDFVREMIGFWDAFAGRMLERTLEAFKPDSIHISEDMAYKAYSMISPEMARKFLLPTWRRWGEMAKSAGVPVYQMDSDGFVGELIPLWIDAGFNCCDPMEVAAGNDINELRRSFGRKMAFCGGVDKREIAKGGAAIAAEIERLKPVINGGGIVPGCDHGVPHDVSWKAFVEYVRELSKATGWL